MNMKEFDKNTESEINERLKAAFYAVIDQQIAEKDPVETEQTILRLQNEGFTKDQSYSLVAQVVSYEVAERFTGDGNIDMERYIKALQQLPSPFAKPKTS